MTGRQISIISHALYVIFFVMALWLDGFAVDMPLEFLHERYAEPTNKNAEELMFAVDF
jgi:hypothetical protein